MKRLATPDHDITRDYGEEYPCEPMGRYEKIVIAGMVAMVVAMVVGGLWFIRGW